MPSQPRIDSQELVAKVHDYNINTTTRELYLFSKESEEDLDIHTAHTFMRNIDILNSFNNKPIILHLCCPGGAWDYGMAIYDSIVASKAKVTILGHGVVASMASIILQAGHKRVLMPNTGVLIHYGQSEVSGSPNKVISWAEQEKLCIESMLEIYTNKAASGAFFNGKKRTDIKKFFKNIMTNKGDVFISPTEAVNYGLADGILGIAPYKTKSHLR